MRTAGAGRLLAGSLAALLGGLGPAWAGDAGAGEPVAVQAPQRSHAPTIRRRTFPGTPGPLSCLCGAPDGSWTAAGGLDGGVHLWEVSTGRYLRRLEGHGSEVFALAADPTGERLASAGYDGRVLLWDTASWRPVGELRASDGDWPLALAWSGDGRQLAVGTARGALLLRDSAGLVREVAGDLPAVRALDWSADGTALAQASGRVSVLRALDGERLARTGELGTEVHALRYAPGGAQLVAGCADGRARVYAAASADLVRSLPGDLPLASLAFSGDGRLLATGGADHTIRIWDFVWGRRLATVPAHRKTVTGLWATPDGRYLLSASLDGTVRRWTLADLERER